MTDKQTSAVDWGRYAHDYEIMIGHVRPYHEMQQAAVGRLRPLGPQDSVLDLGCGTAETTCALLDRFPEVSVHCVDQDSEMLTIARSKTNKATFAKGDVTCYHDDAQLRSAVMSVNVLYTLPAPQQVLRSWWQLLRPDGQLVFATPVAGANPGLILKAHARSIKSDGYWSCVYESDESLVALTREALFDCSSDVIEAVIRVMQTNRQIVAETSFTFFTEQELREAMFAFGSDQVQVTKTFADQCWLVSATKGGA